MSARHPASDRKRRRLRLAGDVAATGDLGFPAALLATAAVSVLLGPPLLVSLAKLLAAVLQDPRPEGLRAAAGAAWQAGGLAAGLVLAAALAGALVPWAAAGFLWAPARWAPGLRPRLQLSPGAAGGVVLGAGLALGCLAALASVAGSLAAASDPVVAALGGARLLRRALALGGLVAVGQGLGRYLLARRAYEQRIRMTDEERRREAQEDQGHPAVRRAREELAARALDQDVPAGDGAAARGMVAMGGPEGPRP